jgi:hypothetical protein
MKGVENCWMEGSWLNCSGCRIQVRQMGDIPNIVRHEASRTYRNKKREYPKKKIVCLKQTVRTEISETYIEA